MTFVSILLYVQERSKHLKDLIEILEKQSCDNFELLVLVEGANDSQKNQLINFLNSYKQKWGPRLKIIVNTSYQGPSYCYNFAVTQAVGQYIAFWKDFLTVPSDFIAKIVAGVKPLRTKPDLIALQSSNSRQIPFNGLPHKEDFAKPHFYSLRTHPDIWAKINFSLNTKFFKRSIIINNRLFMKSRTPYNLLYIYKFLGYSRTYFHFPSPTITYVTAPVYNFSLIQLIKQWVHILNFYRRENLYDEHAAALNFAYFYYLVEHLMLNVLESANALVRIRIIKNIHNRLKRRISDFLDNEYLAQTSNEHFKKAIASFDKHFRDALKNVKK